MQEKILSMIVLYAPAAAVLVLLILVLILAANLRQIKKLNRKLSDTLKKAEDYLTYILEEEEKDEAKAPVQTRQEEPEIVQSAEDAALFQDVLMEYFP